MVGSVRVEGLEPRWLLATLDPVITEFLADNDDSILDEDGADSDWIEIYNPNPGPLNLAGWKLTDTSGTLNKWTFPNAIIQPNSYMTVFASSKDRKTPGGQLHTNFSLNNTGEYLALVRPDNTVASFFAPQYPEQLEDISYGLAPPASANTFTSLLASGAALKYLVPTDDALGATWTTLGFTETGWTSGNGGVGFGIGGPALASEVEPNETSATATNGTGDFALVANNTRYHIGIRGTITSATDEDFFKIGAMQSGDVLTVSVVGLDGGRGTLGDPTVELWRLGSGSAVSTDTDGGVGKDSLIYRFSVGAADTYYVKVKSAASTTGTYDLGIYLENSSTHPSTGVPRTGEIEPNNAVIVANDASYAWKPGNVLSTINGSISAAGDVDVFKYQFSAGDLVSIIGDSTSTLDARITLTDSNGVTIAFEDGTSTSPAADSPIYGVRIPQSGVYYLTVRPNNANTGNYKADVYITPASASPPPTLNTNLESAMPASSSAYVRIPFNVANPGTVRDLTLLIKYTDGFVAYINGTEVARRNALDPLAYNSTATGTRSSTEYEAIDISDFKAALSTGANVLAIHVLNNAVGDPTLAVAAELWNTSVNFGAQQYFSTLTPAAANVAGSLGVASDIQFSVDRGFFASPFTVTLTTDTPAPYQIRYTLDGKAPTATTGTVYSSTPISITKTTTLRAAVFKSGFLPSTVETQTYIFLSDVITQPANPAGFPTQWINTGGTAAPGADYEMDPEVVNNPAYSGQIIDALKAIPTLSIVMNVDDLFGNGPNGTNGIKGIYSNPTATDADNTTNPQWERPASVELMYPDGTTKGFQINAGIQIQGGASRDPNNSPKHSLRLLFKERYGPGQLEFPLFGEDKVDQFDAIILRAGYNNSWLHHNTIATSIKDQRALSQYTQDMWANLTQTAMSGLSKNGAYVHLYLNGLYWGLYNPVERPEASFMAAHRGGAEEDWDVINNEQTLIDGNKTAWDAMFAIANAGLSTDTAYQQIQQYLHIDDFIDYMMLNYFGGNGDWDDHNWYAARRSRVDGVPANVDQFRFYSFDAERLLEGTNDNRLGINNDMRPTRLFTQLRANAEFRLRFADHVHKHLFNNGALTPAQAAARYAALADMVDEAVIGESARWGDYRRDVHFRGNPGTSNDLYTKNGYWLPERNRLLVDDPNTPAPNDSYFSLRTNNVLNQFRGASLYPTINAPEFNQHGGTFASPPQITITNTSGGTVLYRLDGLDPRLPGGTTRPGTLTYTGPFTLNDSAVIKVRTLSGGIWSAITEAPFIVGPAPTLRVTEVMYNPEPDQTLAFPDQEYEYIELQNTGASPINISGATFTNGLTFTFPANTILQPGQFTLLVKNQAAFEHRYGQGLPIGGVFTGSLDNEGERITLQTWVGQLIQSFSFKDGWFDITDGLGFSIVPLDPNASDTVLSDKAGWRPSTVKGGSLGVADDDGTPGEPDDGYAWGSIVINEILSHTDVPTGDWIELHNTTNADIDISGWALSDDINGDLVKYRFPAGAVVPHNGFLTFNWRDHFGQATNPGVITPFGFSELGDEAALTQMVNDQPAGFRESVDFGAADQDVTFGRYVKSTGGSDFTPMAAITLNLPNSSPRIGPIVISEIMYNPVAGGDEFIELKNISASTVPLYDPDVPANTWKFTKGITCVFPTGTELAPGALALVVGIDPTTFRTKYNIPAGVSIFGPWTGNLSNAGEKIELSKPGVQEPGGPLPYIVADRVNYDDEPSWVVNPDGLGPSLVRFIPATYGNDAGNWVIGPAGGSPGAGNPLVIAGSADPDVYSPRIDSSGTTIQLYINDPVFANAPAYAYPLDAVDVMTINGMAGDDSLIVDLTNGNPIPPGGLVFSGSTQTTGDTITVIGDGIGSGTYLPKATTSGQASLTVLGRTISFTSVESSTVGNFELFTFTSPNAADALAVETPVAGLSRISGNSGGVTLDPLYFHNISTIFIDTASRDAGSGNDNIAIGATGVSAPGVNLVKTDTGTGNNSIVIHGGAFNLQALNGNNLNLTTNLAASITLASPQTLGQLTLNATSRIKMMSNPANGFLRVRGLSIPLDGALDLFDNDLIVTYTASNPLPEIQQYIVNGFSTGEGIISTAPTLPFPTTFAAFDNQLVGLSEWLGEVFSDSNQIIAKYTYMGDGC